MKERWMLITAAAALGLACGELFAQAASTPAKAATAESANLQPLIAVRDAVAAEKPLTPMEDRVLDRVFRRREAAGEATAAWFMRSAVMRMHALNGAILGGFYNPISDTWLLTRFDLVDGAWRISDAFLAESPGALPQPWFVVGHQALKEMTESYGLALHGFADRQAVFTPIDSGTVQARVAPWLKSLDEWRGHKAAVKTAAQVTAAIANGKPKSLGLTDRASQQLMGHLPASARSNLAVEGVAWRKDGATLFMVSPNASSVLLLVQLDPNGGLLGIAVVDLDEAATDSTSGGDGGAAATSDRLQATASSDDLTAGDLMTVAKLQSIYTGDSVNPMGGAVIQAGATQATALAPVVKAPSTQAQPPSSSANSPSMQITLTPAEQQAEEDYQKSTAQLVSLGEQWADLKKLVSRTPEQEKLYRQLSDRLDAASKGLDDYYGRLYVLFGKNSEANKQMADVKGDVSLLEDQIAETPHTVALYTLVTGDRYRVIVITESATVAREFAISGSDLSKKVSDFQQVLRNPAKDPKPLAQELYRILIGPVKADLDQAQAETLVWSLDGVLRYVPMAALYDGKQYLVENYNTVTITPASIAHLADQPYMSSISAAAMGISRKYEDDLPPLPAVVGELNDVVKDAQVEGANGVLPGSILLNDQFTEKAMENQLGGRHTVVHIASHFVFKPGDDSQSYLLLAGQDAGGAGYHLTAADFRDNRNLALRRTDLLTLSACETGMSGNAGNGREVDGLGTTAQLKGAKAVISSLWEVNDASTGELMADFYKRWAGGGDKVAKVEALRQAQLDLLQGKVTPQSGTSGRGFGIAQNESGGQGAVAGYAHPYYWAAFVLMGNWR